MYLVKNKNIESSGGSWPFFVLWPYIDSRAIFFPDFFDYVCYAVLQIQSSTGT